MRKVVFTICRDEDVFLPIWLNYYSQYFAMEDIWVFDNNTVNGATNNLPCNVSKTENHPLVDASYLQFVGNWYLNWFLNTFTGRVVKSVHMHEKHPHYDVALYAECDEIFYHPIGLDKFIDFIFGKNGHFGTTKGTIRPGKSMDVFHKVTEEPNLDLNKPIMNQRKYCKFHDILWKKATLTNTVVHWTPGFHETKCNTPIVLDENYTLLHLHHMDYELCNKRHQSRAKLQWANEMGAHSKITGDELKNKFIAQKLELIPEDLRKVNLMYSKY